MNVFSRSCASFGWQGIVIGSSFDGARLDSTKALADLLLGDQHQQTGDCVLVANALILSIPRNPYLHSVLETDLTRQPMSEERGFGHHQPNEIVGEQVNPDFLDGHGRRPGKGARLELFFSRPHTAQIQVLREPVTSES